MIITINTVTRQVDVDHNAEGKDVPAAEIMKTVTKILRSILSRLQPPTTPELIVNEDRTDDITEEMTFKFLNEHEGSIH